MGDPRSGDVRDEVRRVPADAGKDVVDEVVAEVAEAREELVEARDEAVRARQDAEVARDEAQIARDDALLLVDDNPETLVDVRQEDHPEQFGRPGRPLRRNSPFFLGFVGALGVLVAYFLVQAILNVRSVLVLIVVSLFLAVGLNPVVEALIRRGLRRLYAVACVFVLAIAAFIAFGAAIVPPVVVQTQELVANLPDALTELQRSETIRRLNENYGVIDNARAYLTAENLGSRAFGGLVGLGKVVLGAVFSAVTVLVLTLYFLASLPSIKRHVYRIVPASRRERFTLLGDAILLRIGGYVSGAFTIAFIAMVSAYLFLLMMRMPYALALSLLTGVLALIPMVGATLAMLVVATVGFLQSIPVGIACLIYYGVYQQVENYYIYPRVMSKSVDVPAAVAIVAALIGGALLGVVGALLAIPVAAAALLVVREVLIPRMDRT